MIKITVWVVRDKSCRILHNDYEMALAMPILVTPLVFITISKYKVIHRIIITYSLFSERRNQAEESRHSFWAWWTHRKQTGFRRLCDPAPEPRHCVRSAAKYTECRSHEINNSNCVNGQNDHESEQVLQDGRCSCLIRNEYGRVHSHWLYSFSIAPNISTLFRNVQIIWFVT